MNQGFPLPVSWVGALHWADCLVGPPSALQGLLWASEIPQG